MNIFIGLIGVLLVIAGIALCVVLTMSRRKEWQRNVDRGNLTAKKPGVAKLPLCLTVLGLAAFVAANSFCVVPTGYTGVRTTFGLIDQESCMPGFNFVTPFVQEISLVNNKQQDLRFDDRVWAETQEQTVVYMEGIQVTYQIVPESSAWIYANVENWVEELVDPDLTASALKSAARKLDASVVTDRATIQSMGRELLQEAVDGKYGENRVTIKNVLINNMDFEESYNAAIAEKSNALQEQQKQAIVNQTNIDRAKAEADAEKARAEGEADAERIRAQGKADANRIISESITERTQLQDAIDAWNGELPRYVGGADASFGIMDVVDVPSAQPAQ